jgi:hypothetical protein
MSDRDAFECAFVAMSYLLGRRDGLLRGLGPDTGDAARELSRALASSTHGDRARALAAGLLPLATALDARRLA